MGEHPILSLKNINPSGADSTCVLSIYMSGHIGYVGFVFDIRISSTRLCIRRVCMQMCGYMCGHIGYVVEHKTCDILAVERLRLMSYDNGLIIDSFPNALHILKWIYLIIN